MSGSFYNIYKIFFFISCKNMIVSKLLNDIRDILYNSEQIFELFIEKNRNNSLKILSK